MRESRGLSQDELAKRLHMRGATISRYESGKAQIKADDLPKIAWLLGVDICEFYADERAAHQEFLGKTQPPRLPEPFRRAFEPMSQRVASHPRRSDAPNSANSPHSDEPELPPDVLADYERELARAEAGEPMEPAVEAVMTRYLRLRFGLGGEDLALLLEMAARLGRKGDE